MKDFAVVSEGVTDYAVLKNILIGWFKGQEREPFLKPYQPDPTASGESSWQQYGNWENVFRYFREGKYHGALEYADYLIVQIDTDLSEHPNYGVPQQTKGVPHTPEEMVRRVVARLREIIGQQYVEFYGDRIIFAICVRETECWLLPLWDPQRADKCEGCLNALNRALDKADQPTINPEKKDFRLYEEFSKGYKKRKTLVEEGRKNPSLALFLDELEKRPFGTPGSV